MKKSTPATSCLLFSFIALVLAAAEPDYVRNIEKWRADRETNLKKESGWLSVAGLSWLKEGTNTVGAGDKFDVRLTENFKAGKFGQIDFENGKAVLKVESGVEARSDGNSITGPVELVSDEKGKPTEIRTGTQTFFLIKREERYGIRVKDSNSEARRNFAGLHWFPVNEAFKVTARLEPGTEQKEVKVPNVLGGFFKMKSPGRLKFTLDGKEQSLQAVEEDDGSLFLIFGDQSNEKETYKSGRFLYADKAVNGETVLDFNKAENPPCAFTPYATCPLPPAGNRLAITINAGEKRFDH
ncbi:MAG TPA: DUF1684 domain-containing protein [Chthoniobacterales bacterium]|nr:DUF1684 domain-containing protein [Chthoniobacterales bacterium]